MMIQYWAVDKSVQTHWENTFSKSISDDGTRQLPGVFIVDFEQVFGNVQPLRNALFGKILTPLPSL